MDSGEPMLLAVVIRQLHHANKALHHYRSEVTVSFILLDSHSSPMSPPILFLTTCQRVSYCVSSDSRSQLQISLITVTTPGSADRHSKQPDIFLMARCDVIVQDKRGLGLSNDIHRLGMAGRHQTDHKPAPDPAISHILTRMFAEDLDWSSLHNDDSSPPVHLIS
jgi:hypothetical protein